MSRIEKVNPVKLFIGCIFSDKTLLVNVKDALITEFGPIDYESEVFPFTTPTRYYEKEMGEGLEKIFYSFQTLINPIMLKDAKNKSSEMEEDYSENGRRKINLDPGYIDFNKVILASYKYGSQKIFIGDAVWADLTLFYEKGSFKSFPWSFPDFKNDRYYKTLFEIRQKLKSDYQKTPSY